MKCEICNADPSDGSTSMLQRVNRYGVAGRWRCEKHMPHVGEWQKELQDLSNELAAVRKQLSDAHPWMETIIGLEPNLEKEGVENFDGYFAHWNEVIERCNQAWEKPPGYSQSPLELITKIIDERDDYRKQVKAQDALLCKTQNPYFDLDDDLREILGRVCIHCAGIAGLLRHNGYRCKTRAEDEQAVTIHFLLTKYFQFGPGKWREEAEKELRQMAAKLKPEVSNETT